ncbi:MAG: hypothetical protein EOM26_01235 [Alphaproteobacteria bacterium]|nr:hypothetical protein [Alphaproteobacteria bacterium]
MTSVVSDFFSFCDEEEEGIRPHEAVLHDIFHEVAIAPGGGPPAYAPHLWRSLKGRVNCLTYGLDIPAHGIGVPGRLMVSARNGERTRSFRVTTAGLIAAFEQDGLVRIARADAVPDDRIIEVFHNGFDDFHVYRRDSNGRYSHMPLYSLPRDTDERGKPITDPKTCDRGPNLKHHAGCFRVPPGRVRYLKDPALNRDGMLRGFECG